jgi:hypothetical protein
MIFIGYSFRSERAGWLVYENSVCTPGPLAGLITFERSVSRREKRRVLPPAAECCEGVSSSGSTSTVQRHAALSDLALELKDRSPPAQFPPGRSDKRGREGRLRSPAKGEIPFTSRRRKAGTLYSAGFETARSNVIRPASGFRALRAFIYSSQSARSVRKPQPTKIFSAFDLRTNQAG